MPRPKELTKTQIGNIRFGMARHASRLSNRLAAYALDEEGKVTMTPGQVKAAGIVLSHVLPGMQQAEITDLSQNFGSPAQAKENYHQLLRETLHSLKPEELAALMKADA
jgi:hypothetical protein